MIDDNVVSSHVHDYLVTVFKFQEQGRWAAKREQQETTHANVGVRRILLPGIEMLDIFEGNSFFFRTP